MRTLVTCVLMMLAAADANAQWSSNWPSWSHPKRSNALLLECHSGLVERATACNYKSLSNIAPPVFYRFNRSTLTGMKGHFVNMLNSSYVKNKWISPMSYTSNVYTGSFSPVSMTVTALCAIACLPTNYFAYTPWRCLSGVGPFTNDASVGHGYGYTNEYTAAGGTNFPAGRSTWYTTDYGIDGLTNAIHQLWALNFGSASLLCTSTNSAFYSDPYHYACIKGDGASEAEAMADTEGQWNNEANWSLSPSNMWQSIEWWADTYENTIYYYDRHGLDVSTVGAKPRFVANLGWNSNVLQQVDFGANWYALPSGVTLQENDDWFGFGTNRMNRKSVWETVASPVVEAVNTGTNYVLGTNVYKQTMNFAAWPRDMDDLMQVLQAAEAVGFFDYVWE